MVAAYKIQPPLDICRSVSKSDYCLASWQLYKYSWIYTDGAACTCMLLIRSPLYCRPISCNLSREEAWSAHRESDIHSHPCPLRERTVRTCSPCLLYSTIAGRSATVVSCELRSAVFTERASEWYQRTLTNRCAGSSQSSGCQLLPRTYHRSHS